MAMAASIFRRIRFRWVGMRERRLLTSFPSLLVASTLTVGASPAAAQDATWLANPGSGDFNTAANWNPAAVPTGIALFGTSNTTALSFSADTTIGGWTFNPGASAYTFSNTQTVQFNGAGIVVNGGTASITNNGVLNFLNASTAGSASIANIFFNLSFFDNSTAGSATITNHLNLFFNDNSTAGSATIINSSLTRFGGGTAGNANITNNNGADLEFLGGTAGN